MSHYLTTLLLFDEFVSFEQMDQDYNIKLICTRNISIQNKLQVLSKICNLHDWMTKKGSNFYPAAVNP